MPCVQTMRCWNHPHRCYIVAPLAPSMDPECRIGKSRAMGSSPWEEQADHSQGQDQDHATIRVRPCLPLTRHAYHHLCRCKSCMPSPAGLCAWTVSATRSSFVPSLAWTLALVLCVVSWSVLSGNWGSTSGYPQRVYAKMVHGVEALPQRANMGLVFLFHAGEVVIYGLRSLPSSYSKLSKLSITSKSHRNIKYSKWLVHGVLNIGK